MKIIPQVDPTLLKKDLQTILAVDPTIVRKEYEKVLRVDSRLVIKKAWKQCGRLIHTE